MAPGDEPLLGGTSASSSSTAGCLLGNQQGGVLTTTKASPHTRPLYPLRSDCERKRVDDGGRTLLPGEMRRAGSVPLWQAGGRSQGTARQTGGGFCSCMASGTYLVPEQPRAH